MKQVFTIDNNDEPHRERSVLSIRLGERHAGFAITDHSSGALQQLAWYTGEEISGETLDPLFELHEHFNDTYQRVQVCYDNPRSLLIPTQLYREQETRALLNTCYGVSNYDLIFTDRISSWQMNNTYAVPKEIHQWVTRHFSQADIFHQYSVAVKNIEVASEEAHFMLDFRSDDFSLIVCKGADLVLAQCYNYSSPSDVVYYLLKACMAFGVTPENIRVSLSGLIDRQSILYRELYQYFINVEFKQPAWSVTQEKVYPAHFFTALNDLSRCAS